MRSRSASFSRVAASDCVKVSSPLPNRHGSGRARASGPQRTASAAPRDATVPEKGNINGNNTQIANTHTHILQKYFYYLQLSNGWRCVSGSRDPESACARTRTGRGDVHGAGRRDAHGIRRVLLIALMEPPMIGLMEPREGG